MPYDTERKDPLKLSYGEILNFLKRGELEFGRIERALLEEVESLVTAGKSQQFVIDAFEKTHGSGWAYYAGKVADALAINAKVQAAV